jgi:NADH-quinone oxidoreductase subunit L
VKSGVYLVARLVPLFYYGYWVADIGEAAWFFHVTAWVGAFTAFLAATQGMVAVELKKVLAYSTVSQIGYMLLGLGAAGLSPGLLLDGYTSGIFHLVSHALFKACLFLCAGTVIHAVHSIYIHDMGNMRQYLPLTWLFTLVASLSLIGLPPFPGFWSKDAVLLVAADVSTPLLAIALVTVAITAFYTVRFFGIVFHGPESDGLSHSVQSGGQVNDGAFSMRLASGVLAVTIVIAGLGGPFVEEILHHGFDASLGDGTVLAATDTASTADESALHGVVPVLSVFFLVVGAAPAAYIYVARKVTPAVLLDASAGARMLYAFFWNRWYIDALYHRLFVTGTTRAARFVADRVEATFDRDVHRQLPWLFTEKAQQLVHRLRADTEELLYNVSYVLVLFVMLLVYLFVGTDGG